MEAGGDADKYERIQPLRSKVDADSIDTQMD